MLCCTLIISFPLSTMLVLPGKKCECTPCNDIVGTIISGLSPLKDIVLSITRFHFLVNQAVLYHHTKNNK